jgi:Lon protease-like protein
VVEEVDGARGYRRMRVDWSPWRRDMLAAGQPPEPMADRQRLLATIKRYFATNEISADWRAITETPDDRLITTLAMVCPFSPNEKQALLEAPGPAERARTLVALMEMGSLQAGDGGDRPRH